MVEITSCITRRLIEKGQAMEKTIIESLSPQIAQIRLTDTMINKYIMDAKQDTQKLAGLFGVDYSLIEKGQKVTVKGVWHDGSACNITFYRAKTRGDKRISISSLKRKAKTGDLIGLSYITDQTGKTYLAVSVANITALAEKRAV